MIKLLFPLIGFFSLLIINVSCEDKKTEPNVELIQDMMDQESIKPQEGDKTFPHQRTLLLPPKGSVPVGFKPYKYKNDVAGADKNKNPLSNQFNPEILKQGRKYFEIACSVCHGQTGQGDGSIAKAWPMPIPKLTSNKVRDYSDGRLYHVITEGQGLMGSYRNIVPRKYRWQLVNYIRNLQKLNPEEP